MELGVFSVCMPEYGLDDTVSLLKAIGYDAVEWRVAEIPEKIPDDIPYDRRYWVWNESTVDVKRIGELAPRLRRMCDDAGLSITGFDTYLTSDRIPEIVPVLEAAKAAGTSRFSRATTTRCASAPVFCMTRRSTLSSITLKKNPKTMSNKKKVVVAFSGGLDTSYTVMYLAKEKGYEVHAACANTGGFSEEQLRANEENAYRLGATKYVTLDVTREYYDRSLKYMIWGNVLRNGTYPISVSSERIFQGMAIARYAKEIGADAIAHGSTGAGNDQVRFDMTFLVMCPDMEIITLTRDGNLSRKEEVDYLNAHGFNADFTKLKYSYNVGIWGTSICGGEILDSREGLPETAYLKQITKSGSEILSLGFTGGELCSVNGKTYDDRIAAIKAVEEIGAAYGIGRDMHVGDTIIGIKGRVGFEAAAPMLIIGAHKFLEKFTLSKWQQYWKDQVANWYGMFLHESQYLEPVMRDIEAMLESSQRNVNGTVTLELRPWSFSTVGVDSPDDLVKSKLGEYGETQKGWSAEDAKGFIKVLSTPLRVYYGNHKDEMI